MKHNTISTRWRYWIFAAALLTFALPATGLAAEQTSGKAVSKRAAAKEEKARLDRIAALSWKNTPASSPLTITHPDLKSEKQELIVPPDSLKTDKSKAVPLKKGSALSWSLAVESHNSAEANLRFDNSYRYEDFLRTRERAREQGKGDVSFLPGKAEDALPLQEIKLGMQLAF